MHAVLENMKCGGSVGGECIKELRHAHDTTLITKSLEEMTETLRKVVKESAKLGLKLSPIKTIMKLIGKKVNTPFKSIGKSLKQVQTFNFSISCFPLCCQVMDNKDKERKKIAAFQLSARHRLPHVSWTEHMTNNNVLQCIGNPPSLMLKVLKLQLCSFGYIVRKQMACMEKIIVWPHRRY